MDLVDGNGVELGERFFDGDLTAMRHLGLGERRGTRGGILKAEQDRSHGLLFGELEFVFGDSVADDELISAMERSTTSSTCSGDVAAKIENIPQS